MLARYLLMLSSCVCVSVACWYYIKTAKPRIMQITQHSSTGSVVFSCQIRMENPVRFTVTGEDGNFRFDTDIDHNKPSLLMTNDPT